MTSKIAKTNTAATLDSIHTLEFFCELTHKACALESFPTSKILTRPNGWTKLANVWTDLIEEADIDIFRDTIRKIKWGVPPKGPTAEYALLIDAVCEELFADGPAFRSWIKVDQHKAVIREENRDYTPWCSDHPYCYSEEHNAYLQSKMLLRIGNYKNGYKAKSREAARVVDRYENSVKILISEAEYWSVEYWLDENHIYDALYSICKYDYRKDPSLYDTLLCMLHLITSDYCLSGDKKLDTLTLVCNVTFLPAQWVAAIWPNNTINKVVHLFFRGGRHRPQKFLR